MNWSWKLGEFRGIAVYMHATFLIPLAFVVISHWSDGHSNGKTLEGVNVARRGLGLTADC